MLTKWPSLVIAIQGESTHVFAVRHGSAVLKAKVHPMRQIKQFATFLTCAVLVACGGGGGVVEIDAAPEVSLTTNSKDVSGTFEVSASFSEAVEGFEIGDISVTNGELSNFVATNAGLAYTFDVTPQASGDVTLKVQAGVARDGAGNPNEASNTLTVTANLTGPSVTLRTTASDPVSGPFSVTATFSEAVEGFVVDDLVVTNADVDGFAGSGADYSFNVTPKVDGTVTIDVPAGVADVTGGSSSSGGNTAAEQLSITADLTAPTILSLTTEASEPVSGIFSVKVVFSEPVEDFTASDIDVVGGQVGAFSADSAGAEYDFDVTPLTTGTLTVDVPAGVAQDPAGNANTAATPLSVEASLTAPTLSLTTPAEHVPGDFLVTATFSEDVTDFEKGDISVDNGEVSGDLSGSGADYTFTVAPTNDGPVTIDVAANAAVNGENTGNLQASTLTVTADFTAPSVVLATTASGTLTGSFTVTATFSESVTGFVVGDVTVANGAVSHFSGSGADYSFDVTPTVDTQGTVTVDVLANVAVDRVNWDNTASNQLSLAYDLVVPTVTLTTTASGTLTGSFSVTAAFSESVTDFEAGDISVSNGAVSNFSGSGADYSFDVTPTADTQGTVTVDVLADVAVDSVNNGNTASNQLSFAYDLAAPTVTLATTVSGTLTGSFNVTATFSESVTGFDADGIAVANGAVSNFSGSGANYSFDVTPTADTQGTVTVDVLADVAVDGVSNANTASNQLSLAYDLAVPTVTLTTTVSGTLTNSFNVTATFSEPVTGFVVGDVTVVNGAVSNFSGSGAAYSFDVTPAADTQGTVTVDILADVAADSVSNANTASNQLSFAYDVAVPTVTLATGATGTLTGSFNVTATFSESVTGFVVGDITVVNGAVSNFSGSGAAYSFDVTPAADTQGTVTVDILADVAADSVSNANTASNQLSFAYDLAAPTVTLATSATGTLTDSFSVTATFSESVTGFVVGDVTVVNGAVSNFSGSEATYSFDVTPTADTQGTVTVDVLADVAVDGVNQSNTASNQLSFAYDVAAPTVALATSATGTLTGSFNVTATFSESVTGFVVGDVSVVNGAVSNFSGSGAAYSFDVTPTADTQGTVTVDILADVAADSVSNANTASNQLSFAYDVAAPTVALATSATGTVTDSFSVTATFSESVTGFVVGDVTVVNGAVSNFSGSEATYSFDVTPTADTQGTVTVDILADVAVDGVNQSNAASNQLSFAYDVAAPTVALATSATGTLTGSFSVTATFSESVTGFVVGDVSVVNGAVSNFSGSEATYSFDVTPTADTQGTVTVDILADVAVDGVNQSNTASNQLSFAYDVAAPTVALATNASGTLTGSFNVTATFSESVTGFVVGDVTVVNGAVSNFSGSEATYSFDVTPTADTQGTITVDVLADVAADSASNANKASNQLSLAYDLAVPTVTLTTTASGTLTGSFSVTATFSESVTGFVVGDVTVVNGAVSNFSGSDATYSFDVTPTANTQGTVTVDVLADVAVDGVNQSNTASNQLSFAYDATAPSVTLATGATGTLAGRFNVTATFSESVTGFVVGDVTVVNGAVSNFTGSEATYSFDVTPTADTQGTVTVDILADVAVDSVNNGNTASNQLSFAYDVAAPTVTLATNASGTLTGGFSVTATFSESVTGFVVGDVTVVNGAVSNFSGSEATYSFDVTPTADTQGTVTVDVLADVAADSVSNVNTASNQLSFAYDVAAPTVTLATSASGTLTDSFNVTATFSESVTGFVVGDVSVVNGAVSNFTGSEAVYSFDVTPTVDTQGTVTVDILADVAVDGVNQSNAASNQLSFAYDVAAPTVALATSATGTLTDSFSVTATFSESVTGFVVDDVTVVNGAVSNFSGSEATYSFDVTPTADTQGTVTVDVMADVAVDGVNQSNAASNQLSFAYDVAAPTVALATSATGTLTGSFNVTATFSESVTGFVVGDVSVVNGAVSNFSGSGAAYSFDVTPTADTQGTVTVDVLADVAADSVSNANTASNQLSFAYDVAAPTVALTTSATGTLTGSFNVTATFSESVTDFVVGDVTVVNGAVSNFSGSEATYSFDVTPTADTQGTVTVDVPADVAVDGVNQGNEASNQLSFSYDSVLPSVQLSTDVSDPLNASSFTVEATFSEPVSLSDLDGLTLVNATRGDITVESTTEWTFEVTPDTDGEVRVDMAAGVAVDDAGNPSAAASTLALTADYTPPTVAISTPASSPVGGTFTVKAVFSEPVYDTFIDVPVLVTNGTYTSIDVISETEYSIDVTPDADGEVTVQVVEGAAADAAGNLNPASDIFSISVDLSLPTVSLSTGAYSPVVDTFRVTATFSEDVTGFDSNDVTLGNGVLSNFSSSDEEPIYTFDVTPQATGDVTVDVAAGVAQSTSTGKSNATAVQLLRVADLSDGLVGIEQIYGGGTAVRDNWGSINDEVAGWDSNNVSCVSVVPTADTSSSVDCVDANYTDEWSWRGKSGDTNVGVDGPRGTGVHAWGTGGTVASFETSESLVMGFTDSIYPDNGFVDHDPIGAIGARQAYSLGITGAGVKVAVVDTGIDTDHVDLDGKITSQYDLCKDTAGVYNCDTVDTGTGDHGTHVAGIIAAKKDESGMHGVAYDAELVSIYFAENSELGLLSDEQDFADAIDGAVTNGVRIFNNSWGTVSEDNTNTFFDDQELVKNAVASAIAQGSVFVWAAGNSYSENTGLDAHNTSQNAKAALKYEEFMGGFVNVVNLVWDDSADEWVISNELSNSSNEANSQICGVTKDYCLGAPGSLIVSTVPDHGYLPNSGTSMAAPMVSGGLALLFQAFPYVETADILELLFVTADDLGAEGVDEIYGHGMMNLAAALEPSGSLTIATSSSTATNTGLSLTGASLSGDSAFVGAMSTAASDMVALDAFDRAYTVGATGMTTLGETETLSAAGLSDTLRADFEGLAGFGSPITEAAALGNAVAAMDDQISLPDATLNYRAVSKETSTLAEVQYVALSSGDGWQVGQSIALTQEQGQLFGNVGTGAYALADAATTLTVGSNGTRQLGEDWTLFGGVGLSQTAVVPAAASVIAMSDQITSASAVMGLRRDQLGLDQTASFAVQVSQDRRVLNGSALTTIPVGRDDGGVIVLEETRLDEAALSIVPKVEMTYEEQINVNANITYSASSSELENVLAIDFERAF